MHALRALHAGQQMRSGKCADLKLSKKHAQHIMMACVAFSTYSNIVMNRLICTKFAERSHPLNCLAGRTALYHLYMAV